MHGRIVLILPFRGVVQIRLLLLLRDRLGRLGANRCRRWRFVAFLHRAAGRMRAAQEALARRGRHPTLFILLLQHFWIRICS